MKKQLFALFWLLFLAGVCQAQTFFPTNCASIASPVTNQTRCVQSTTTGGRIAGREYSWNGSIWIESDQQSSVNAQTGTSYTVSNADSRKLVTFSNASPVAVTLPQASSNSEFLSGWFSDFQNRGAGLVTITPTTSTIDGAASITLSQNDGVRIHSDGTNYFSQRGRLATHASRHQHGGTDEVATATPGANAIPKAGAGGTLGDGWLSSNVPLKNGTNNFTGTNRFSGTVESDAVSPSSLSSDQDDYTGCATKNLCRQDASADATITSFTGGGNWRSFIFINISGFTITLPNEAATGTAANKMITPDGNSLSVDTNEAVQFIYDNTTSRWRVFPFKTPPGAIVPPLPDVMAAGNAYYGADCTALKAFIVGNDANNSTWLCHDSSEGMRLITVVGGVLDAGDKTFWVRDGYNWYLKNRTTGAVLLKVDADTPNLTGSAIKKSVQVQLFGPTEAATTGDGKAYFRIPSTLDGYTITAIQANVVSAGTTGTLNIDVDRCAAAATGNVCSGTVSDVLSTNLTIDSGENDSSTAATPAVINASNAVVTAGQVLRFNTDAIHTTPSQGGFVNLDLTAP